MKMKRKFKKRHLFIFILIIILLYFGPSLMGGYSWTEKTALINTPPYQDEKVVYEKGDGNYNIVILDTGSRKYAKLIQKTFGLFYRTTLVDTFRVESTEKDMITSWSARRRNDKSTYDTLFTAEILNKDIVKVVVSNDNRRDQTLTLNDVKRESTFYKVMEVKNGYATQYSVMPNTKFGDIVFRGINSKGEVISVY